MGLMLLKEKVLSACGNCLYIGCKYQASLSNFEEVCEPGSFTGIGGAIFGTPRKSSPLFIVTAWHFSSVSAWTPVLACVVRLLWRVVRVP